MFIAVLLEFLFLVSEGFENEIHFLLEAKGCELQGEA